MPPDPPPPSTLPPADQSAARASLPGSPFTHPGERRALGILALIAVFLLLWIAQPLGIGITLGMLSAFWLQPVYHWLRARTPRKPDVAAAMCVVGATLGLSVAVSTMGYLLVVRGVAMVQALIAALGPGGTVHGWEARLTARLAPFHVQTGDVVTRLREAATEVATRAASLAAVIASATASALLTLFFVMMTMHYTLRNWDAIRRRAETLLPLNPRHTRELLTDFQRVGSSVLAGTAITGIAQGGLAFVGYMICGVPQAAFYGALTAVASLIPAVGTLLVWVPIGIWLILTGHPGAGIGVMVYGSIVVVGVSDYVIRPRMVGRSGEVPTMFTFVALFGGVEVFGLVGLVLGPVILSLALAILGIYEKEVAPTGHFRPSYTGEKPATSSSPPS